MSRGFTRSLGSDGGVTPTAPKVPFNRSAKSNSSQGDGQTQGEGQVQLQGRMSNRSLLLEAFHSQDALGDGSLTKFRSGTDAPHLIDAVLHGDLDGLAMSIMAELGVRSQVELFPLVNGVLTNLTDPVMNRFVSTDDALRQLEPFPGAGAGTEAMGSSAEVSSEEEVWRRVRRALFSDDAALILQQRVLDGLRRESFQKELADLRSQWLLADEPPSYEEQSQHREDLCMERVLEPVMLEFGFQKGRAGLTEMEIAVAAFAAENESVEARASELEELLGQVISGEEPLEG